MKHKNRKKILARLVSVAFTAVLVTSLLPMTASARESGLTVLMEDYCSLLGSEAVKVPGLTYRCSEHGRKLIPYYVTEKNDSLREIPGVVERVGNQFRYIFDYYCPDCYAKFAGTTSEFRLEHNIKDTSLETYFSLSRSWLQGNGFFFDVEDDVENYPLNSEVGTVKAENAEQPKTDDPIGNWDVSNAHSFYELQYNGLSKIIDKPTSGKLNGYLASIDRQAKAMFDRLVKQMAAAEGITEHFKRN